MPVPVDSEHYHQAAIEISVGLLCTAPRFRLTLGQTPKGGCILSPTSDIASATQVGLWRPKRNDSTPLGARQIGTEKHA
jgi:hypothetical protein